MTDEHVQPTVSQNRIPSLDFLRGIAVLGILFINIEAFAYPDTFSPWKFGFSSPIDQHTRFWVYFLTQGKFYTMFALLFGVGFYIFLERLEKRDLGLKAMDIYARRLLWLFIIGVAHAYLIWHGDVLYHYAICGLLLFPFRSIKTRNLLLIVAFICFLQFVKTWEQTTRKQKQKSDFIEAMKIPQEERTKEEISKIESWKNLTTEHTTPDTSQVKVPRQSYLEGIQESYRDANVHKGLFYYQGLLFQTLIAMILGIVFYRTGIFNDLHAWKHYWLISIGILIIGLAINYLRFYRWTYGYFNPVTTIWDGLFITFSKEILGVAYILLFNGIYQKYLQRIRFKLISNIGRMALTNYIFQNILLGLIFYGYGLAQFNKFSRFELLGIVICIWIIQLLLSWFWLGRYQQGPLEWGWRKLTYSSFQRQPQYNER